MQPERHKVLLFQRTIRVYRDAIFQRLYKSLGVVVCHSPSLAQQGKQVADDVARTDRVALPGRFLRGNSGPSTQAVLPVLLKYRPRVVIAQFSFGVLTFWKLLLLKPLFRYKLIPWSHGIKNEEVLRNRDSLRTLVVLLVYRNSDAILFYSIMRQQRLLKERQSLLRKSFVAYNTLDTQKLFSISEEMRAASVMYSNHECKAGSSFNIVYLGRLLPDKRVDLLVSAWELLQQKYDLGLIIIGGGPEQKQIASIENRPNVICTGTLHNVKDVGEYLIKSDIMIMPGYVGLSIVHGFAFGLPMITCRSTENGPFHSPEIEYLKDGYNGFF